MLIAAAAFACGPAAKSSADVVQTTHQANASDVDAAASKETSDDIQLASSLTLTVHKSPTCGCCKKWVEHMEAHGFKVVVVDHEDMTQIKNELGVKAPLQSCHTAKIGNYVIEGHVPAEDVLRMLREKPEIAGLAAPGMPNGSPGMEGMLKDKYDVLSFDKTGATKVYSHR
jgi:hypothetical protein